MNSLYINKKLQAHKPYYTKIPAFTKTFFISNGISFGFKTNNSCLAKIIVWEFDFNEVSIGLMALYIARRVALRLTAVLATFLGATADILVSLLLLVIRKRKAGELTVLPFSITILNCLVESLFELGIMLWGKAFATFCLTARKNLSACSGSHARTETVAFGAFAFLWIVSK